MRVLSLDECAERADIVRRTLDRAIARGEGPPVVDITARRRGVLEADYEAWLLGRRRPILTDQKPPKRGRGRPRKTVPVGA